MATASPKLEVLTVSPTKLAPEDILTPAELAARLKVPLSWVYKHTDSSRRNKLPVLRCDGFLRFSWPDVVEWLHGNCR